ncbi:hypothetical protein FRC11_006580, partial [Ceratobasidium sp. 423]
RDAGLDPDAALGGILFGSDKTHLTHYTGDIKVHALYASLGNIKKDVRAQTSKRAWMLVAYIPICKWEATLEHTEIKSKAHGQALPGILSHRLFHLCMEIICQPLKEMNVHEVINLDSNVHLIFYVLLAYLADLEEQYLISALDKSNSGKYRLGDVEFPFWEDLPFVHICQVLSVDLLHGFHKFFYDHPYKWNMNSLGEDEIDAWMKAQVPYSGSHVFAKGVSHISQMSGKEHQVLQTVHLGVVANSPGKYSRELTLATRALLDTIYWAQLPSHTTHTLEALKMSYAKLHKYMHVWIKNESRQGEKGNVIPHFNILKFHTIQHLVDQILAKGMANNFSTETIEHMHMDTLKDAFPVTNKKDWEKQMIRWLVQCEKILEFLLFQTWRKSLESKSLSQANDSPNITMVQHLGEPCAQPDASIDEIPANAKGKRQINDEDISEECTSKCILQSQQNHGLHDFQDIALVPSDMLTMAEVQDKYELPSLLSDYKVGNYPFAATINRESQVQVWKSVRLLDPQQHFFPKGTWRRAQACAATAKEPAVADPVLYAKEGLEVSSGAQSLFQLKGWTSSDNIPGDSFGL